MCSQFQLQKSMENSNNYQGDLADIFLGGGSSSSGAIISGGHDTAEGWQFPEESSVLQDFGDPFCNLRDPLFHDLDMSSSLLEGSSNNNVVFGPKVVQERNTAGSVLFQISPPTTTKLAMSSSSSPMAALNPTTILSAAAAAHNDLSSNSALQISSPRNTGIKRRKSQAKKVVCIPATAPANSRQGGEVVPSDLWAWRKYGQKPIKGSPYPRGYYRCSSSKGCSARKQVERSRTDPNMLVITYTSEHNHPWPTQRNALAGSTRSAHPHSKNTQKSPTRDEQLNISKVKEEVAEEHQQLVKMHDVEFSQGTYQPALPESSSNHSQDDFFADLAELEADPLNLLFARTLSGDDHEGKQKKAVHDTFNLYHWSGNNDKNKDQVDP